MLDNKLSNNTLLQKWACVCNNMACKKQFSLSLGSLSGLGSKLGS